MQPFVVVAAAAAADGAVSDAVVAEGVHERAESFQPLVGGVEGMLEVLASVLERCRLH